MNNLEVVRLKREVTRLNDEAEIAWRLASFEDCVQERVRIYRFHLGLQVDDVDQAVERLCALGASQPDFQPGDGRWRVLLDPDGQPSCLSSPAHTAELKAVMEKSPATP